MIPLIFIVFATWTAPAGDFAGKMEMSGLHLGDYANFDRDWREVTVRYRKDTDEMRFVYANDLAWKTLQGGGTDYPDGAVFAKIAVRTESDPAFTSSSVPSGVRRYQLMVKNRKKFESTQGWGYALFDEKGLTFPEDPEQTVQACAACHQLVENRGYVFSKIMSISPFTTSAKREPAKSATLNFADENASALPAIVRKELPANAASVRLLVGPLREHLFQGTLDEIRPALAEEAVRTRKPALLLSLDGKRFSIVTLNLRAECGEHKTALKSVNNILSRDSQKYEVAFCQTETQKP
jgi:hypothetical protein